VHAMPLLSFKSATDRHQIFDSMYLPYIDYFRCTEALLGWNFSDCEDCLQQLSAVGPHKLVLCMATVLIAYPLANPTHLL
jgi:hypothetical protein